MTALTDDDLYAETVTAIRRAAQGEANGGDDASYNHAMDMLAESQRRLINAGHDKWCASGIYDRAFVEASGISKDTDCSCGKDA
ncbi:hypothetical protein AMIS_20040 [Actinoplanes missouriensis 431]|uniref:Uncharacterized protein n=1 Tax=Actinoplanes missouriensis (strain ATCC 14538 / DSM 43046 / CBS 188.64 / JCM 3121 / NBRC 102363 / NCIMB 12654 / NRRL B-3342 / UNCC 431) TaxID=512565 RepID=I0H2I7_ACTM4|nr:hypothetical protein [Actinoplanes missouriensis]BAL87224.1 hypothetical protein AMIS_20040 [Actinoplanes missouriensis 431]